MDNKKIAVLIPCYNEARTIEKVVNDYKRVLPEADIYVYDNNSTDGTDEIASNVGAIVKYEYRQGKGNVIRTMFHDIDADGYLMVDGDDTYPAEYARKMIALVTEEGADMVIGDRLSSTYFRENKRPFHNLGNTIVRSFVNKLFGGTLTDIMTGYRAFSPLFVKSFPVISKGFEIETEMSIFTLDKNLHWKAVPVEYRNRPNGSESKLNTYSDGFKVLITIMKLYKDYRPFSFFGGIALVLFMIGGIMFVPVFVEFLENGLVPRFPTLFVAICFMIIGMQALVCGIILDTVAKFNKKDFEIKLNTIRLLLRKE